jgi:hypothetical protein
MVGGCSVRSLRRVSTSLQLRAVSFWTMPGIHPSTSRPSFAATAT